MRFYIVKEISKGIKIRVQLLKLEDKDEGRGRTLFELVFMFIVYGQKIVGKRVRLRDNKINIEK